MPTPNKTSRARETLNVTRRNDARTVQDADVDWVFVDSSMCSEERRE
jgi:hypothetical protein